MTRPLAAITAAAQKLNVTAIVTPAKFKWHNMIYVIPAGYLVRTRGAFSALKAEYIGNVSGCVCSYCSPFP